MMRKLLSALLVVILLLAMAVPALADPADPSVVVDSSTDTGIDIVMVIDRSGTMKTTDRGGIALAATQALATVSKTNASARGGVSMAIVPYGYAINVDDVNSIEFYNVSDENEFNQLSAIINGSQIRAGNDDTNTGLALETAYDLIAAHKQKHPYHTFAVVLLSDGEVDIGDSTGFKNDKSGLSAEEQTQESIKKGDKAAENFANDGIPLYCIGIYPGNDKSKLGTDMRKWANMTGSDNYQETNDINEVQERMDKLLKKINENAEMEDWQIESGKPGYFEVQNGTMQVNIRLTPKIDDLDTVHISYVTSNPDGTESERELSRPNEWMEDTSAAVGTSDYTFINIFRPKAGKYKVLIDDNIPRTFKVLVTKLYDLRLALSGGESVSAGKTTTFYLDVTKDGRTFNDPSLVPTIMIRTESGNYDSPMASFNMTWDDSAKRYVATYPTSQSGTFYAKATLQTDLAVNESDEKPFTITNTPITPKAGVPHEILFDGKPVKLYRQQGMPEDGYDPRKLTNTEIDDYFDNLSNLPVTRYSFAITGQEGIVDWKDEGDGFSLQPRAAGETSFEIRAIYNGGNASSSEPATGTIRVVDAQKPVELSGFNPLTGPVEISEILPSKEIPVIDDVNALFSEPNAADGESFTVRVLDVQRSDGTPASDALEATQVGGQLNLVGKEDIEGAKVALEATSTDGSTARFEFEVTVVNKLRIYLLIAAGAAALLVLIIIIIIVTHIHNKPSFRRGATLYIRLTLPDDTSEGEVGLQRYGKKAVKLSTLCTSCGVHMGKMRSTMDKILLVPKKNGGVLVRSNLKGGKKESVLQSMDNWNLELSNEQMIELNYDEN